MAFVSKLNRLDFFYFLILIFEQDAKKNVIFEDDAF